MKLLRETIRKLILEEVCAGATEKIQQGLDEIERRNLVIGVIKQGSDYNVILNEKEGMGSLLGQFDMTTHPDAPESVFVTAWTEVDPSLKNTGVGAVLYDVAIEVATKLGKYLTCDRISVTDDAKSMWRYYATSDDYEAFQMDTRKGDYTPDDKSDDCADYIFHNDTNIDFHAPPQDYKDLFMASPFTKAYRKKRITTIPCLGDRYREI
jgi:GNAT superfamily N-acetyltransferase